MNRRHQDCPSHTPGHPSQTPRRSQQQQMPPPESLGIPVHLPSSHPLLHLSSISHYDPPQTRGTLAVSSSAQSFPLSEVALPQHIARSLPGYPTASSSSSYRSSPASGSSALYLTSPLGLSSSLAAGSSSFENGIQSWLWSQSGTESQHFIPPPLSRPVALAACPTLGTAAPSSSSTSGASNRSFDYPFPAMPDPIAQRLSPQSFLSNASMPSSSGRRVDSGYDSRYIVPSLAPSHSFSARHTAAETTPATKRSAVRDAFQEHDSSKGVRHIACDFCRSRKLKCIVDEPGGRCRQCLRRGYTECALPSARPEEEESESRKTKKRIKYDHGAAARKEVGEVGQNFKQDGSSLVGKEGGHAEKDTGFILERPEGTADGATISPSQDRPPADDVLFISTVNTNGLLDSDTYDRATSTAQYLTGARGEVLVGSRQAMETGGSADVASHLAVSSWPFSSTETSAPGLGPGIARWGSDWWDRCLSTFGHRPRSIRFVEVLLHQFIAKHATLMSAFHGDSFLGAMQRPEKRRQLNPAVVFAALAAAVCDLKVPRREEPFAGDITAADASARRLAHILRRISKEYIDVALISGRPADFYLAQAAGTLALTETQPMEHQRLMFIVERTLRGLEKQLPESAYESTARARCLDLCHPDYLRKPVCQSSVESDIVLEGMLRTCKIQVSLACRQILAKPDEDITSNAVPDFVLDLREYIVWEPSRLIDGVPAGYYASAHFSRISSLLAKSLVRLMRLDGPTLRRSGDAASNPDVRTILEELSLIETTIPWLRAQKGEDAMLVLPRQAHQLFIQVLVFTRVSLWRKTGVWILVERQDGSLSPSINWWMNLFARSIQEAQADADACFCSSMFDLKTSTAQIEAALRHAKIIKQLLQVLSYPHHEMQQLLHEGVKTLRLQINLRPGCVTPGGVPLLNLLDDLV